MIIAVKYKILDYGKSFDATKVYNLKESDALDLIQRGFAKEAYDEKVHVDFLKEETQIEALSNIQKSLEKTLSYKETTINKSQIPVNQKEIEIERLEPIREEIKEVQIKIEERKRGRPSKN